MGIFGGLFGNNDGKEQKEEKSIPWIALSSLDQLEEIEKNSLGKPQIIFKHSTTCGISRMVMNMFNSSYDLSAQQADLYYLDLHSYREVSNEVGYRFQVLHQSPQLLVIKNGTTVAHASHNAITAVEFQQFV